MIFDYSLAALVTAGLLIYLTYALLRPERFYAWSPSRIGFRNRSRVSKERAMTLIGWIQIVLYCAIVAALVIPLGGYMTRVFNGERTFLSPVLRPVEAVLYRLGGVDEKHEQHWLTYTIAMLLFHVGGFLILYVLMRTQAMLPFNPAGQSAVAEDLSFNTAVSFITNTNWQNYGGESTMSYLVQMLGLTHQNFLSAATGIVLAVALIRGFARSSMKTIGNFWVDVTRCTLYILLPICIVYTLFLVWQGIPQTLGDYVEATTLEGAKQTIAVGPVASQIAIKMLGTNGGGFFNANAAHPFENPTALSNFVQMISIFAIGAALTNVFGRMVGNQRQGWAIFAAMGVLFIAGVAFCYWAEAHGNDALTAMGLTGGNMEGKEVRFGIVASALFAVITTAASCGAVNAMHDSFTALGGMIPLINIQLGEIIVGGVGAGLYGMLLFVIIAIFVAGLMVGRTPEYVGKKIEAKEVKMAMLAILILPLMYLGWTSVAVVLSDGCCLHGEPGAARFHRGSLCLHLADRQQRLGLCRAHRQHPLLQRDRRHRDAGRPVLDDHPGHGDCGLAGGEEIRSCIRRYIPDHGRPVHRSARRRDPHHRRPHLLPGACPRTHRRAFRDDRWHAVLIELIRSHVHVHGNRNHPQADAGLGLVRSEDRDAGDRFVFREARPADADQEPGHVRGRGRRGVDHDHLPSRTLIMGGENLLFTFQIIVWLWLTVLFANFAEAVAEGRGKAQADALRRQRTETQAKLLTGTDRNSYKMVAGTSLKVGDVVLVEAGHVIPSDGEVIEGIASVNEAAITGESAPVIRESGGDRSAVTGGTQVLSDWIKVRITAAPGSTFLDRMIKLVEGAERQKTPNEIALNILLDRLDHHLRLRDRDNSELRGLRWRHRLRGDRGGTVRDPDPHDHRGAFVGHRHCRHGPARALQRARDVGSCGRSGRRRRYPAA